MQPKLRSASQPSWMSLGVVAIVTAMFMGMGFWHWSLRQMEGQTGQQRNALKKLVLSGGIPPNQEVIDYLTSRQSAVETRYRRLVEMVGAPPPVEVGKGDVQLYFQEQVHDIQRTIERLATARSMPVPEQLGVPKELPPTETVPRLLVQLGLMQEAANLIFEQGVMGLASLKIEDPQALPGLETDDAFLVRLPVRVRLTSSLPQLMKVLGAIERTKPLMDLRALRIIPGTAPDSLDVDLLLSRYLVTAALSEPTGPAEPREKDTQATRSRSSKPHSKQGKSRDAR